MLPGLAEGSFTSCICPTHLPIRSLPRIQLPPGAAVQLAACTALRELEAELAFTVRDADLRAWTALGDMRSLRLAGNFYLSEEAISTVLAAMPRLRLLRLETVQGGGGMLAPLAQLRGVRVLELAGCHLNCAAALRAALCSASGLTHLRVHVSAGCGSSCICSLQAGVPQTSEAGRPQICPLTSQPLLTLPPALLCSPAASNQRCAPRSWPRCRRCQACGSWSWACGACPTEAQARGGGGCGGGKSGACSAALGRD